MEAYARCVENEPLALYILEKRQALAAKDGYKEKLDATLSKAYRNVCDCKHPICSLRDASQIQGIGQWVLKMLKGFFPEPVDSSQEVAGKATAGDKPKRRYVPQKSSAPYAILLTLYKAMQEGREYMKKQELIDAADASGLSQMAIQPNKCSGPSAQFGHTTKDWYSGWSSMKTLVTKGLVVKSSCPAKYKLTEEGISTAEECLRRSGAQINNAKSSLNERSKTCSADLLLAMVDDSPKAMCVEGYADVSSDSDDEANNSMAIVLKSSQPSKYDRAEDIISTAVVGVQKSGIQTSNSFSGLRKCSSSMPSTRVEERPLKAANLIALKDISSQSNNIALEGVKQAKKRVASVLDSHRSSDVKELADAAVKFDSFACYDKDHTATSSMDGGDCGSDSGWLHLPPLMQGEKFLDRYAVILILDDRERFMNTGKGNTREKFAEQMRSQFQIEVEIRHLPIGDTLWLARHKVTREEYVLDFIVERKNVSDLLHSIRDTRYKQQKLRLMRCGLRKLIYVVEGDPNVMDSAESIKTACFSTEIVEGFDVQRTCDVRDTMRKYGDLTHAISAHYNELSACKQPRQGLCKTYRQFVEDCKDLDREKVSDVFGVMLMQVKQVTESIALTILEKYPTPLSLVSAYSKLKGDEKAQENLLKGLPIVNQNKEISSVVSKRVYQFICSPHAK